MKKYWFLILFAAISATAVFGQDTAAQQQIDKLSGQIQDLLAAQGKQDQVIAGLRKEISELRDKVNTPQVNDSASREDLKTLAEKVQEIDKRRQADRDLIVKQIEQAGKVSAAPPAKSKPAPKTPAPDEIAAPIVFLCTPLASFITGEVLNINGGTVMAG